MQHQVADSEDLFSDLGIVISDDLLLISYHSDMCLFLDLFKQIQVGAQVLLVFLSKFSVLAERTLISIGITTSILKIRLQGVSSVGTLEVILYA